MLVWICEHRPTSVPIGEVLGSWLKKLLGWRQRQTWIQAVSGY